MLSTTSLILSTTFSMTDFSSLPSSMSPSQDRWCEPDPVRLSTVPCIAVYRKHTDRLALRRRFPGFLEQRPAGLQRGTLAQVILDLLDQGFRFGHLFEGRTH